MNQVVLFSPSGALMDEALLDSAKVNLNNLGFDVLEMPQARQRLQRFAGDESTRIASLAQAVDHGTPSVLMATRGGYGLSRILPLLNFEALAASLNSKGHLVCGHSDITSLQLALLSAGAQPRTLLHGPMACFDFGATDGAAQGVNPTTSKHFQLAVHGGRVDVEWCTASEPLGPSAAAPTSKNSAGATDQLSIQGPVWGGNLTLLCSMLGTPWLPSMPGGILVLEDVNEPVYKIERMLLQLLHAGVLAQQQAVVLGKFSEPQPSSHDNGYCFTSAVEFLQNQLGSVPFLMNFPFGHCTPKACWFQGGQGSLTVTHAYTARLTQTMPGSLT